MDSCIQVFIKGIGGNTSVLTVEKNCPVDDLLKAATEKLKHVVSPEELQLVFGGKQLEYGAGKHLEDYNIQNRSTLLVVCRLRGGWNPTTAARLKKKELKPLPGFVSVTTTEACMISLDDDSSTKRAKMACGHVICPSSMSSYARSCLDEGKYTFPCPYIDPKSNMRCTATWEYFTVRHVAALSQEELQEFESMLAENYTQKAMGVQKCPGCSSFCMRQNKSDKCVRCPICTKENKKAFEFCWSCLQEAVQNKCVNKECDGADPRIRILSECPTTKMGYTNIIVPSIRACPSCGILITHIDGCKQMNCIGCKAKFCFVCLQKADKSGKYTCGVYKTVCTVASRQTHF